MLPLVKYVTLEVRDLEFFRKHFTKALYFNELNIKDFDHTLLAFEKLGCRTLEFLNYNGGAFVRFVENSNKILPNKFKINKTGVIGLKIKTNNLKFDYLSKKRHEFVTEPEIVFNPYKKRHFHSLFSGLIIQIFEEYDDYFTLFERHNTGLSGLIIGVSDIEKSVEFYSKVLKFRDVIYFEKKFFPEDKNFDGKTYKCAVMKQTANKNNIFSLFLGNFYIELVEVEQDENNEICSSQINMYSSDFQDIVGNYYFFDNEFQPQEKQITIYDPDGLKIQIDKQLQRINTLKLLAKFIKQKK